MVALVSVWGLRLALHIYRRNRGKGEDFRYRQWREEAGASWWWHSYLRVFLLQGVIMWIVAAPVAMTVGTAGQAGLGWLDAAAVLVWVVGFAFEAVGDWQLTRFKADPANKGRLMTGGLWRYTRHPNYFGEIVLWVGILIIALPVLQGWQWVALISPVFVTLLLTRVSGVPLLEKKADKKWGGQVDYETYKMNTPVLIPRLK